MFESAPTATCCSRVGGEIMTATARSGDARLRARRARSRMPTRSGTRTTRGGLGVFRGADPRRSRLVPARNALPDQGRPHVSVTHLAVSLVRDAYGKPDFAIAMAEDITEQQAARGAAPPGAEDGGDRPARRRRRARLQQPADRDPRLHRARCSSDAADGSPLRDDLRRDQAGGRPRGALTRQLLAFSRKQVLQPRVLDLNGDRRRACRRCCGG